MPSGKPSLCQYIQKTLNYTNRKRKFSLRKIWDAILYFIKTGCQFGPPLLLMRVLKDFLSNIRVILADGGYRGELIDQIKKKFGYSNKISLRKDNSKKVFEPIGKRWVIERTARRTVFSWFDNDRRLCRNYELLTETAEEIVKVSAIKQLLNKI
jgi:transposase